MMFGLFVALGAAVSATSSGSACPRVFTENLLSEWQPATAKGESWNPVVTAYEPSSLLMLGSSVPYLTAEKGRWTWEVQFRLGSATGRPDEPLPAQLRAAFADAYPNATCSTGKDKCTVHFEVSGPAFELMDVELAFGSPGGTNWTGSGAGRIEKENALYDDGNGDRPVFLTCTYESH